MQVAPFLAIEEAERAARGGRAAAVGNDVDLSGRHEEVSGAGFNEPERGPCVPDLPRVGRCCNQHRISSWCGRPVDIRKKIDAVAHRHVGIVIAHPFELRCRQIAIDTARCLRTIQLPLAGLDPGNLSGLVPPTQMNGAAGVGSDEAVDRKGRWSISWPLLVGSLRQRSHIFAT